MVKHLPFMMLSWGIVANAAPPRAPPKAIRRGSREPLLLEEQEGRELEGSICSYLCSC